jgi:hypothetical protein
MKNAIRITSVLMAAIVLLTLSPTAAVAVPPTPSRSDRTVLIFQIYLPLIMKNHLLPCDELIVNGGFEYDGDWEIPTTAYSADYTVAAAHSGSRSMRLGIVEPADEVYSYSSVRQTITIPADVASATLRFWLYPMSDEPAALTPPARPLASTLQGLTLADDMQYVLILDQTNQWIRTLLWQRSDDRVWTFYPFDLMDFAGQTIKLQFGVLNDGLGGITSMYLDDVSLELCTVSPCSELIANSGFEATEAWTIGDTPRPAGYTTDEAHWGARSMRLGIEPPTTDAYSWSSVRQRITIPADAVSATLSFWYKPFTEDISQPNWQWFDWKGYSVDQRGRIPPNANLLSWVASDWQQALILADDFPTPTVLATVMNINSNSGVWTSETFDLMPFAGQTVWVYFNVYNDGGGDKRTWMYLDDVSVQVCP